MSDDTELSRRWAPTLSTALAHQQQIALAPAPLIDPDNDQDDDTSVHTGVMVAFYPTPAQAQALALPDGEDPDDLHLTLAYLGDVGTDLGADAESDLVAAVAGWASDQEHVQANINGVGMFSTPSPVTYANVDAPALPAARQSLIAALDKAGYPANTEHGYTPHMTLAYADRRDHQPPPLPLRFTHVHVAFAGNRTAIPLGSGIDDAAEASHLLISERPTGPDLIEALQSEQDQVTAFVTDIAGRTVITAPARTLAAIREPSLDDITAQHMLWMHGRFVGAETPNRNGALWSAGDLEMATSTVTHGPLNWLHDARHVIGTLAKADYVAPGPRAVAADSATTPIAQPHITATAAIWRWIYPDEAYVVQQASDQQMLWYSMECISREVSCVGDEGCGNTTSYADYMAGAACEHVIQRASVRRFKDPVFLGGAVIVPPTRPGWAEADARVVDAAAAMAEAAFEQAGQPDVAASDWEQLMAQVIRYALAG